MNTETHTTGPVAQTGAFTNGISINGTNRFGYWVPTAAQHSAINGLSAEFYKLMALVEKTIPHGNIVFAAEVTGCLENAFLLAVQGIVKPTTGN